MSGPNIYTMQCPLCKEGYFEWTDWDDITSIAFPIPTHGQWNSGQYDRDLLKEYGEWRKVVHPPPTISYRIGRRHQPIYGAKERNQWEYRQGHRQEYLNHHRQQ